MLSVFPELLFLAPFAALVIRLAVGIAFIGIAWQMFRDSGRMANVPLPLIGQPPAWFIMLVGFGIGALGLALVLGFMTQIAALAGMFVVIARFILGHRYDAICPLVFSTQAFLFVMCFSLVLTGAGPFAFDLPL